MKSHLIEKYNLAIEKHKALKEKMKIEEANLKLRSKVNWLILRDKNKRFFS